MDQTLSHSIDYTDTLHKIQKDDKISGKILKTKYLTILAQSFFGGHLCNVHWNFKRQNLPSKVDPRTVRVKICMVAVDP